MIVNKPKKTAPKTAPVKKVAPAAKSAPTKKAISQFQALASRNQMPMAPQGQVSGQMPGRMMNTKLK